MPPARVEVALSCSRALPAEQQIVTSHHRCSPSKREHLPNMGLALGVDHRAALAVLRGMMHDEEYKAGVLAAR